ncbi:endonuclease/exonuclease/phosphatase family protein, partial [Trifolium pratense]
VQQVSQFMHIPSHLHLHPVTSFHSGILVISRAYGYLLNPCGSYFKPFKDVGFCYGRGGGIALLWRSSYNCSIVNFSQNHINVQVTDQVNGNWRLTGFYGFPNGATEKKGRTDRAHWLINGFRSAVTDAGLIDVHMEGHPLTWFKSLGTIQAVKERLDRALTNDGWFQLFPNAILENLPALVSDHYPILLIREPGNNNMRMLGQLIMTFMILFMIIGIPMANKL